MFLPHYCDTQKTREVFCKKSALKKSRKIHKKTEEKYCAGRAFLLGKFQAELKRRLRRTASGYQVFFKQFFTRIPIFETF